MELKDASLENIKRILENLSKFNSTPEYGTTRVLFTKPEVESRNYIKKEMKKTGLDVEEDAIGNIFGTLKGTDSSLAPVWTGSHIDTVLNAGNFDGMTGVVSGIEALRNIKESGKKHKRDIKVIVYTSEEPTRFGLSCLGSRAMAGKLSFEEAQKLRDKDGNSLADVLKNLKFDVSKFSEIPYKNGDVFASIELHIEQGAVLESLKVPIGVVTAISGPSSFEVTVTGKQSHAGGTPMDARHDAFLACCEISLKLEELAKNSKSKYTVSTVGKVDILPNASNVIPGKTIFSVDIRDSEDDVRADVIKKFADFAKQVEQKRGVIIDIKKFNDDPAVKSDEKIINVLEDICKQKNIKYNEMVSGAYHDTMMVGKFAPVAMIFVPSKDGISHSPKEWTDYEDIVLGTDVLTEALFKLSND